MSLTLIDWSGIAVYIAAIVLAAWLAFDLYVAWRISKTELTRNLFVMSVAWVVWSVLAVLTILVINDPFWRDVTRTLLRISALTAIASARWAIRAR